MSNKQSKSAAGPPSDGSITASVGAIITAVPKGSSPFAVAYPTVESITDELTANTSITFSLNRWREKLPLEKGQVVKLGDIRKFARGWRASSAAPVQMHSSKQ